MKTYTFHVTVEDLPNTWRRVELAEQQTLRDLHVAIQEAFDWDPDDDIAFVVGDKPLEGGDLYDLNFDDWDVDEYDGDWDEDEDGDDEDGEVDALIDGLSPLAVDDMSPSEKLEEMLALLENDPQARSQVRQMLIDEMGLPAFMADMMLNSLRSLMGMMSEEQLAAMMGNKPAAKNAAVTTLESLGLGVDKTMLYVYGEDDWHFFVRVEAINENAEDTAFYPLLLDGDGPAPEQYFDEEDEEDEGIAWLWEEDSEEEEEDSEEED
jgi:hypothetical protein